MTTNQWPDGSPQPLDPDRVAAALHSTGFNVRPARGIVLLARAERRVQARDRKIAALQREVQRLALELSRVRSFDRDLERVVVRALSNVRMIPVLGIGREDRILEVRATSPAIDSALSGTEGRQHG